MKHFKGVVFDFNGTLLWDTHLHNQAWDIFLESHHLYLSDQEKNAKIHGKNNELILPAVFGSELSAYEIGRYIAEKESIYQMLCLKSGIDYAPGAVDFINYLRNNHIPYAVATASGKENIDFYISHLGLDKLVDRPFIVYNNGSYKSKPDPDIFLAAIKLLKLDSSEVIIFEDSIAGIKAASLARPGKVIVVDSLNHHYRNINYEVITSFNQVNLHIFK
jgi:beta-phosphoglucomutase